MASRKGVPPKGKQRVPSRPRMAAPSRPQVATPSRPVAPAPAPARAVAASAPVRPVMPAPARPTSAAAAPPTGVKIGAVMAKELAALNKAKQISAEARIPEQKAQADRETAIRTLRLKKMVDTSKQIRGVKPKKKKIPHIQPVAPSTVKLRQAAIAAEAIQKQTELKKLVAERMRTRNPLMINTLNLAIKQKKEEIKHLDTRHKNLDKGVDVYRPQRISPSVAPKQRVSLLLPPTHVKPTKEETEKISRAIIMRTPRRQDESNDKYRARLFALIQRALARFAQLKTQQMLTVPKPSTAPISSTTSTTAPTTTSTVVATPVVAAAVIAAESVASTPTSVTPASGSTSPTMLPGEGPQPPSTDMSTGQMIVSIAEQTVAQDGPTVAAEIDAGGVVADPAADAMADSIDQAADTLNAAVVATEGVTGDQLAVEAEGEIAQQLEEAGGTKEGQTVDAGSVPLYKQPVVIAGAIAALGFYLYKRGVFTK